MRIALICAGLVLGACSQSATPSNGDQTSAARLKENAPEVGPQDSSTGMAPDTARAASTTDSEQTASQSEDAGACRTQGGIEIAANRLKAVGTEPFWSATTKGRCVTYSTPENQEGTRIWTAFTGSRDAGKWTGYLGKERFIMETRPEAGCSDGMSDRDYPVAVTLTIGGEMRRGCATPD